MRRQTTGLHLSIRLIPRDDGDGATRVGYHLDADLGIEAGHEATLSEATAARLIAASLDVLAEAQAGTAADDALVLPPDETLPDSVTWGDAIRVERYATDDPSDNPVVRLEHHFPDGTIANRWRISTTIDHDDPEVVQAAGEVAPRVNLDASGLDEDAVLRVVTQAFAACADLDRIATAPIRRDDPTEAAPLPYPPVIGQSVSSYLRCLDEDDHAYQRDAFPADHMVCHGMTADPNRFIWGPPTT